MISIQSINYLIRNCGGREASVMQQPIPHFSLMGLNFARREGEGERGKDKR